MGTEIIRDAPLRLAEASCGGRHRCSARLVLEQIIRFASQCGGARQTLALLWRSSALVPLQNCACCRWRSKACLRGSVQGWAAASGWLRSGLPAAASQHTVLPVVTTGVRGVTQLTGHRGERWSAIAYRTGLAAGMWRVCPARHTTNVRLPRPSVRVASSRSPGTTSTSPLTGGSYTRKAWRGL